MLTHFSLFTGIGGVDIAAEWAGFQTVGMCEIDDYCNKVLDKHWPDVPKWRDIYELKGEDILGAVRDSKYNQAVELYSNGLSIQQVADYFNITRQAMWKILQRRGVELRPNTRNGEDNHFYRGGETADDKAQNILEAAIKSGKVERQYKCQNCDGEGIFDDGRTKIQAHHPDYNKPLAVMWLCQPCHHEWHKNNKAIPMEVMPSEARTDRLDLLSAGFPS